MRAAAIVAALCATLLVACTSIASASTTGLGPEPEPVLGEPPLNIQLTEEAPSRRSTRATPLNRLDRAAVARFYMSDYRTTMGYTTNSAAQWTGSIGNCGRGDVSPAFRTAILRRINYFRTMAGVPTVYMDTSQNSATQGSSLIMSANVIAIHNPPPSSDCYSSMGASAAGRSLVAVGLWGADAVSAYINDGGSFNAAVGHRRWLLYPALVKISTGDAGYRSSGPGSWASSIQVIGHTGTRPANPAYVVWPSAGYFPFQALPPSKRFSFSHPKADFSVTRVYVTRNGVAVDVNKEALHPGYADETIVFNVHGLSFDRPKADVKYEVRVENVIIGGVKRNFKYTVIVFDPNPPVGPHCKKLQLSGRVGAQSIINGLYVMMGNYNGVPYYKDSLGYFLYFKNNSWLVSNPLGNSAYIARAETDVGRAQDINVKWTVWNGSSHEIDGNIDLVCKA